jgi:Ca2+-binding EF-hand superfamily protein
MVETVNQIQQPEEEDAVSQSAPLAMPNPAEMRLLKELFQSLDADGGGTLTLEEIKAGLQGREDADYIY